MKKETIPSTTVHCRHQNDFCIKIGSDESHFNVLLSVRDTVSRWCPQTTAFKEGGQPKACTVFLTVIQDMYSSVDRDQKLAEFCCP